MKVSAVMVTLPARRTLMTRAIAAWTQQTHAERELVVVVDQGPADVRADAIAAVAAFGRSDILIVAPPEPLSLGALRNLGVERASGEAICVWDDDDLHHPRRIERQLAALAESGAPATVLQDVMLLREGERILHWTNWAATPAGGLPGTLLCRRSHMPRYAEAGPDAARGEDLDLLLRLRAAVAVRQQAMEPHLYVYVSHAGNTSGADHLALLTGRLSISKGLLQRREAALREGLAPFGLGGVGVEGSNGRAFSL